MSVRDYCHIFNSLASYAPDILRTMRDRVHYYVDGLANYLIKYCRGASLLHDIDIIRRQAFTQTTKDLSQRILEADRDREQFKRARTMGSNMELDGNFRPPFDWYPPWHVGSVSPKVQGPQI